MQEIMKNENITLINMMDYKVIYFYKNNYILEVKKWKEKNYS